jgi:hypothetical protein
MSNDSYLGRWAAWYDKDSTLKRYGDGLTYKLAAEFVSGFAVEDWGCGRGWFRTIHDGPYVGIDGTASPHADVVADLRVYRSSTPAVWMRHVLEHNYDWRQVLDNAVASAEERIVIILFTPDGDERELAFVSDLGVPDLVLPHDTIVEVMENAGFAVQRETLETGSQYGEETILLGLRT